MWLLLVKYMPLGTASFTILNGKIIPDHTAKFATFKIKNKKLKREKKTRPADFGKMLVKLHLIKMLRIKMYTGVSDQALTTVSKYFALPRSWVERQVRLCLGPHKGFNRP